MLVLISIGIFILAAGFGVYLAERVLGGVLAPWPVALLHGLFAATALAILIYAIMMGGLETRGVLWGAGALVVAALGGFVLAGLHVFKVLAPQRVVVIHALAAVSGVSLLVAGVLGVL